MKHVIKGEETKNQVTWKLVGYYNNDTAIYENNGELAFISCDNTLIFRGQRFKHMSNLWKIS